MALVYTWSCKYNALLVGFEASAGVIVPAMSAEDWSTLAHNMSTLAHSMFLEDAYVACNKHQHGAICRCLNHYAMLHEYHSIDFERPVLCVSPPMMHLNSLFACTVQQTGSTLHQSILPRLATGHPTKGPAYRIHPNDAP